MNDETRFEVETEHKNKIRPQQAIGKKNCNSNNINNKSFSITHFFVSRGWSCYTYSKLWSISDLNRYLLYLFLNSLIRFHIAVIVSIGIYPLDIIKCIIDKNLQLSDIFFFCAICSNCLRESIQNSVMICCFIELSCFFSTLYVLWIFYSRLTRYRRYLRTLLHS